MDRAYVTLDNGQEAEVLIHEFTLSPGPCCEAEVEIKGFLTRPSKRKHQVSGLEVTRVIYNDPATVIYWSDDTRTVVKCQPGDKFNPELGFLLAVLKKACDNTGKYNDLLRKYVPGYGEKEAPEDGHE